MDPLANLTEAQVVRIYERLPPEPGGMEKHVAALSDAQREAGLHITTVYAEGAGKLCDVKVRSPFRFRKQRTGFVRVANFYIGVLLDVKNIKQKKLVVLHIHGDIWHFIWGLLVSRRIGAAVCCCTIHDALNRRLSCFYKYILGKYDLIYTTGKREQEFLINLLAKEVHHLPSVPSNGFRLPQANATAPPSDVITVANFYPKKRLDLVVDIAKRLPSHHFLLVGDGPTLPSINKAIEENDLNNVTLTGKQPSSFIANAMLRSKIFLLTSEFEGTPTVIMEAMLAKLPVITTPSNDYGWLITESGGIVSGSWEANELCKHIELLMLSEQTRKRMGGVNFHKINQMSWARSALRVSVEYSIAIQKKETQCAK